MLTKTVLLWTSNKCGDFPVVTAAQQRHSAHHIDIWRALTGGKPLFHGALSTIEWREPISLVPALFPAERRAFSCTIYHFIGAKVTWPRPQCRRELSYLAYLAFPFIYINQFDFSVSFNFKEKYISFPSILYEALWTNVPAGLCSEYGSLTSLLCKGGSLIYTLDDSQSTLISLSSTMG